MNAFESLLFILLGITGVFTLRFKELLPLESGEIDVEFLFSENNGTFLSLADHSSSMWTPPTNIFGLKTENFSLPTEYVSQLYQFGVEKDSIPSFLDNDRSMLYWFADHPSDVDLWNHSVEASDGFLVKHDDRLYAWPRPYDANEDDDEKRNDHPHSHNANSASKLLICPVLGLAAIAFLSI
ncbi:hypothetical protein PAEPH01_1272 [Pancytospora epiphaga]|nr:hypothetical protein PAEPH01_1272 [Pancytospora epiphaga]